MDGTVAMARLRTPILNFRIFKRFGDQFDRPILLQGITDDHAASCNVLDLR
jgi:hypothetical protein